MLSSFAVIHLLTHVKALYKVKFCALYQQLAVNFILHNTITYCNLTNGKTYSFKILTK